MRCSLIDVNCVKAPISIFKSSNWLKKEVNNKSVDEIIMVVSKTATTLMRKTSKEAVAGFQAYKIRYLDNKLSTTSDIETAQCPTAVSRCHMLPSSLPYWKVWKVLFLTKLVVSLRVHS